tara:strand:- start:7171 stop:7389 length:219 start_codon:yes stop_codon:yes gene_type:complete
MVKPEEAIEWVSVNVVAVLGLITVIKEYLPWTVGVIGGCVLIWYNIERALKVRSERKKTNYESKEKSTKTKG